MKHLETKPSNQSYRGERVRPPRWHSRYTILTAFAQEMRCISDTLRPPDSDLIKVLDYGCGNMPYRLFFDGYTKYYGADLPGNDLASVMITEEGKIGAPSDSFDVVISTQVLEHVRNPLAYLGEAHRVLVPGGKLVLSTHGFWMYHPDPQDYWRWTPEGLQTIVRQAGFNLLSTKKIIGLAGAGLQLFQDGLTPFVPRRLRPIFYLIMQSGILLLDRVLRRSRRQDGICLVVLAEKSAYGDCMTEQADSVDA